MKAIVDREKCDGCGWLIKALCAKACPERAIELEGYPGNGRVAKINRKICIGCAKCQAACDEAAIKMDEEDFIEAKDIENINASNHELYLDSIMGKEMTMNLGQTISAEQLPESIQLLLENITEIDKKQIEARARIENLQNEISSSQKEANEAKASATDAVRGALNAAEKPVGLFKTGKAVEALQESHKCVSEVGVSTAKVVQKIVGVQSETAKVQESTMDAIKVLFDFDRNIIETTEKLFFLGCSSIAASRTVCREIELRLNDASKEEISAMAQAELMSVMHSLRAQETLMDKQDKLSRELEEQAKTNENNAKDLANVKERETELIEKEATLEEKINRQEAIIISLENELKLAEQDIEKLQEEINSKSIYIVGAIAMAALLMSIAQLFV